MIGRTICFLNKKKNASTLQSDTIFQNTFYNVSVPCAPFSQCNSPILKKYLLKFTRLQFKIVWMSLDHNIMQHNFNKLGVHSTEMKSHFLVRTCSHSQGHVTFWLPEKWPANFMKNGNRLQISLSACLKIAHNMPLVWNFDILIYHQNCDTLLKICGTQLHLPIKFWHPIG